MKIQQTFFYQNSGLLDMAEKHTVPKDVEAAQKHFPKTKAVDVSISGEAQSLLKEFAVLVSPDVCPYKA